METTIPIFPCKSLSEILNFYQILGFEVESQQEQPYLYAAIHRGHLSIHFSRLSVWQARNGVCLVFVPDVEAYHTQFADALRTHYCTIPTAGLPRITRRWTGQTRFHIFDPAGNVLIFINEYEPSQEYGWSEEGLSMLAQALENAAFLRDTYCHDEAAANVLDKSLKQHSTASPIERARALAARSELAIALGDAAYAKTLQHELKQMKLSDEERTRYQDELQAPSKLERWLVHKL